MVLGFEQARDGGVSSILEAQRLDGIAERVDAFSDQRGHELARQRPGTVPVRVEPLEVDLAIGLDLPVGQAGLIVAIAGATVSSNLSNVPDMNINSDDPRGLKARLRGVGRSMKDLAAFMGVDYNVVFRIASGSRKRVSSAEEAKISEFFAAHDRAAARGNKVAGLPLVRAVDVAGMGNQIPLFGFQGGGASGPITLDLDTTSETAARHPAQGRAQTGLPCACGMTPCPRAMTWTRLSIACASKCPARVRTS